MCTVIPKQIIINHLLAFFLIKYNISIPTYTIAIFSIAKAKTDVKLVMKFSMPNTKNKIIQITETNLIFMLLVKANDKTEKTKTFTNIGNNSSVIISISSFTYNTKL